MASYRPITRSLDSARLQSDSTKINIYNSNRVRRACFYFLEWTVNNLLRWSCFIAWSYSRCLSMQLGVSFTSLVSKIYRTVGINWNTFSWSSMTMSQAHVQLTSTLESRSAFVNCAINFKQFEKKEIWKSFISDKKIRLKPKDWNLTFVSQPEAASDVSLFRFKLPRLPI